MAQKQYEKFNYKEIEPGSGWQKVTIRFDKPQEGDSEHGHWILYGVDVDGTNKSWFVGQEVKDLFSMLKIGKGAELMIRTEYYTKHNKKGEPVPEVFGIFEYKGKEYSFGKETNGEKKEVAKKPPPLPTEEEMTKQSSDDFVCEKYSIALSHVLAEMKVREKDFGEGGCGFTSMDISKMVISVFMTLCQKG